MKLNEQIAHFRKEKGMTQEELANRLGVTGQAVSKWESGQCCPDVSLLPTLADIFAVSIDTLMGREVQDDYTDLYERVRAHFSTIPEDQLWRDAFRLSILLHECLCTNGYRESVPWSLKERHGWETTPRKWGLSARTEPDGTAVYAGSGIYMSYHTTWKMPPMSTIHHIVERLRSIADLSTLRVLYAVFDRTYEDMDSYVTAADLAEWTHLPLDTVEKALIDMDACAKTGSAGEIGYRLDGLSAVLPTLLETLIDRP